MISCRTGRKETSVISYTVKQTLQLHELLRYTVVLSAFCVVKFLLRISVDMYSFRLFVNPA
ncbi:hypothetical protein BDF21DRAFT_434420 [Thamnidium elegans]|nr:hypothetical protein BDF21DRAFT_434420 [Thamnidium elegans]